MAAEFMQDVVRFFKTARHLWGRCPDCDALFRLSDVAISSSAEPPRDWLRRLEKRQLALAEKEETLEGKELDLEERAEELGQRETDVTYREDRLERTAENRVRQILRSNTEVQAVIKQASKDAVQRSRAMLLGKMLERLAPCFRRFTYDPRDMRCISDPFDYVLFDGLTAERKVKQIVFIEVKCGKGRMSGVQRDVREAVEARRVGTELWTIGNPDIPITKQLGSASRVKDKPAPFSLDEA